MNLSESQLEFSSLLFSFFSLFPFALLFLVRDLYLAQDHQSAHHKGAHLQRFSPLHLALSTVNDVSIIKFGVIPQLPHKENSPFPDVSLCEFPPKNCMAKLPILDVRV